jgi:hypothetical protein
MKFISIILEQASDPAILKTSGNKPIVNAIRNKKKISFFYSGPRKPKKNSVKSGKRFRVEPVALGVNSKGKLILRAWVDSGSGSTTKTGFDKTNWRTFILSRMKNLEVLDDTFEKRPGYREDGDALMNPVYVQTSFKDKKDVAKKEKPEPQPAAEPEEKPEPPVEPKPEVKPELAAEPKPKEKPEPQPAVEPEEKPEPQPAVEPEPKELPQPKPKEKPSVNPEEDEDDKNLQESIKRIKTLMFF